MEIKVLKSFEQVVQKQVTETIDLEYPKENKFFKMNDESRFFARNIVIFAIIVKYTNTFLLFEIERGKQFYTDFVPSKDCKQNYWLTDSNDIRRTALSLMKGDNYEFTEIGLEEFKELREELINGVFNEALEKE